MNEICTLLVKLHIICSRMERVNLHARPSIIQVGCPTCYQVCALDHAKGGTADLDYRSEPCHLNDGGMWHYMLYPYDMIWWLMTLHVVSVWHDIVELPSIPLYVIAVLHERMACDITCPSCMTWPGGMWACMSLLYITPPPR